MDTPDFHRLMQVFEEVVRAPGDRRSALLEARCGPDEKLRQRVAALLDQADQADAAVKTGAGMMRLALEAAPPPTDRVTDAAERLPVLSGQYRILRVIGEGGMGTVYEAEQLNPRRRVALKAIRGRAASRSLLRRFQLEAQILARMQHPGIAQIYEAGAADEDQPDQAYFAMELIRGRPLTDHADAADLTLHQRLELIARVCDAVHHAHQRGVIHRDLKPANILVDQHGQPKILDFGVARASGADADFDTMQTAAGQLVGTLPYMSPEQVGTGPAGAATTRGADGVDVRTDVYALGVMLYQLLAHRLPLDLHAKPIVEAARAIREAEPPRLGRLDPRLRGDIETIAARALEKDKERRYQSAAELADELRRCIRSEPILARRDSAMYLLRKQIARHRAAVGLASAVALAVAGFAIYASIQADRSRALADREKDARLAAVDAQRTAERESARADREAAALRESLYVSHIGFAQAAYSAGDADRMRRVLAECPPEQRGWEWTYLNTLADRSDRVVTPFEPGPIGFCYGPASGRIFTWRADGRVAVLDARDGHAIARFTGSPPSAAAESADGLTWAAGDGHGTVTVFDSPADTPRVSWTAHAGGILSVQFSADGRTLVTTDATGPAAWDPATGRPIRRFTPPDDVATFAAISPDGAVLALGGHKGAVYLWRAEEDAHSHVLTGHEGPVLSGVFSTDGRLLATGGEDRTMRVWDLDSDRQRSIVRGHSNKVIAVALSPDGRLAASGGTEAVLRISDAATGRELQRLLGHESTITRAAFTADGAALISCGRDGTVRWWDRPGEHAERPVNLRMGGIPAVAFDPAGRTLVFGAERGGGLLALDPATGSFRDGPRLDATTTRLVFSPDGRTLYTGESTGRITARDAATAAVTATFEGHTGVVIALARSPDGTRLASGATDGTLRLWDVPAARESARPTGHDDSISAILWPGPELLTGSWDGTVRAWDPGSASPLWQLRVAQPMPGAVIAMAIAEPPAGERDPLLVVCGQDEDCSVWNLRTRERVATLKGHQGAVLSVAANPDGTRIVTGGFDNTVRVWDPRSGAELVALRAHVWSVDAVAFSPDGRTIASAGSDGTLRLWHAAP